MYRIALVIGGMVVAQNLKIDNVKIFDLVTFEEAAEIAIKLEKEKSVEIIISPAGTASEVQKHVSLPIVKTDISDFDILETLIHAENDSKISGKRIALIMHESKELSVDRLQSFLKNKLYFYNYNNKEDIYNIINDLIAKGINLVAGGPTCVKLAQEAGIRGYIFRLSDESIKMSINKAKESLDVSNRYKVQNQRIKTALSLFEDGVIIVNNSGKVTEFNEKARKLFNVSEDKFIGMNIEELTNDISLKSVYKSGIKQVDKLVKYEDNNLFSNRIPIIIDENIYGAVITLQDTNRIAKLDQKYRKYQAKGFTAKYYFKDIIGNSDSIKETIKIAKAFSEVCSDILLKGETGTGKELFAQSIHNSSNRSNGPFVAINCAAFPENLLESELMGYEDGAFTGAKKGGKAGLFEIAHMGTIFLDEINQMPIQLQGRILRVLQERQVLRLGGDKVIPVNVRVIVATNENLIKLIDEGHFRKDLYYRISVLNLNIPPLRKRKGDITLLIRYYYDLFTNLYGKSIPFDEECFLLLENHSWGGNIRELINFVERYVVISKRLSINPLVYIKEYLDIEEKNSNKLSDMNQFSVNLGTLNEMENQLIEAVIKRFDNNKKLASMALGISRTTLWKKINKVN